MRRRSFLVGLSAAACSPHSVDIDIDGDGDTTGGFDGSEGSESSPGDSSGESYGVNFRCFRWDSASTPMVGAGVWGSASTSEYRALWCSIS